MLYSRISEASGSNQSTVDPNREVNHERQ
jgi:hypothetical protein